MSDTRTKSCNFSKKGPLKVIVIITLWSFLFSVFSYDLARASGSPGSSLSINTPLDKGLADEGSDKEFEEEVTSVTADLGGAAVTQKSEDTTPPGGLIGKYAYDPEKPPRFVQDPASPGRGYIEFVGYHIEDPNTSIDIKIPARRAHPLLFDNYMRTGIEEIDHALAEALQYIKDQQRQRKNCCFILESNKYGIHGLGVPAYGDKPQMVGIGESFKGNTLTKFHELAHLINMPVELLLKHIKGYEGKDGEDALTEYTKNKLHRQLDEMRLHYALKLFQKMHFPEEDKILHAMIKHEDAARIYGGKGAWSRLLEELKEEMDFETPTSAYITIQEVWGEFIEANRDLIEQGNRLIESDIAQSGKVSQKTLMHLRKLYRRFVLPKESKALIRSRTSEFKGWVIDRSSGRHEDSFIRNLAGIFISPKKRDERLVVQGVKEIFEHAIGQSWVVQNSREKKIDGIPNVLNAEEGFAVVVQQFLSFEVSGTAMSNLYGHTTLEAVVGDADMAVRPGANTAQFLFSKGQEAQNAQYEYSQSFAVMPREGVFSPIGEAQARELYRVSNALEEKIGVPVDIEWGVLDGRLYIIQVRPIIGDFKRALVEPSAELKAQTPIADTPIALGHTSGDGLTGKMVLFGSGVDRDTVEELEHEMAKRDEYYIRVQGDVASGVLGTSTRAKVLVDPEQGSRQAHNVNLITERIAGGEFAYCNGPILKDGLEQRLNFEPHPSLKGVWVSREEVTYFSDGLRSKFYKGEDAGVEEAELSPEKLALRSFQMEMPGRCYGSVPVPYSEDNAPWEVAAMLDVTLGHHMPVEHAGLPELLTDLLDPESVDREYDEAQLEAMEAWLDILDEALSYPLYPNERDNRWVWAFKRVLQLKDIRERLERERISAVPQAVQPKPAVRPEKPEKVSILFVSDQPEECKYAVRHFSDATEVKIETCSNISDAIAYVEGNKVDLLITDYNLPPVPPESGRVEALRHTHDLLRTAIETAASNGYTVRSVVFSELLSKKQKEKLRENFTSLEIILLDADITGFYERLTRIAKETYEGLLKDYDRAVAETQAAQPKEPERLKILFVDDDLAFRITFGLTVLEGNLGLAADEEWHYAGEGYEVWVVKNEHEALDVLGKEEIDFVITDWKLGRNNADKIVEMALSRNVNSIDIATGLEQIYEEVVRKYSNVDLGEFSIMSTESQVARIKEVRQQQLKAYDKALAEWQAAQPQTSLKPTEPQKETVFIVNTSSGEADDLAEFIRETFGERFDIVTAAPTAESLYMLERELRDKTPDIVITDMFIDREDKLDDIFQCVFAENPKAKFIVTSEEAAVTEDGRFAGKNVIDLMEKPFYFTEVIERLKDFSLPPVEPERFDDHTKPAEQAV